MWKLKEVSGLKFFELEYDQKFLIAFTTRIGGASRGNFRSPNLSSGTGDNDETVAENSSRLKKAFAIERLVKLDQIHSNKVFYARDTTTYAGDGLFTDQPGLTLSVKVADCLPIYFFNTAVPAVGIAHAGWRGTAKKIAAVLVHKMTNTFKISVRDTHYAFGPCIGTCCFEVGPDVQKVFNNKFITERAGRFFLDLKAANRAALQTLGLPEAGSLDYCTRCANELFYSARRENPTGRNVALIQIKLPVDSV
jgi:YfiH family protein